MICPRHPAAWLGSLLLPLAQPLPAETLPFPLRGGPAAFDRLLGHVATEPDRFVHSLNRVLLEQVNPQHAWDQVERRKELMELVEDLATLERKLGRSIELSGSKPGRKRFEQLCAELGYGTKWKGGEWTLVAKPGDGAVRGQRLARALGWDLPTIGREAEAGTVTLEIPVETVELPISEAEWRAITDRSGPIGDPLEALIEDQRLGLVLEGRRRVSAETLAALDAVGWHWLYRHGEPFFRYAPVLRFREGRLELPGGPGADRAWATLLGVAPADTTQFVRDLLDNRGARGAFLVHALSHQPDDVVHFYLGAGDATTSDESRFGRQVFRRVDETTRVDFDAAHGGDLGFGTLVRSLPLDPETGGPRLPGGLGLWYVAIRSADAPTDRQALARAVRRGEQRRLTESEFLLAALTEQNDVLGVKRSALPRLIRTAQIFGGREELLTPENVLLLARLSDAAPSALPALETLEPADPESVTDVLLAVAHLSTLKPSADHELLLAQFQGGVEWMAAMARADRVDPKLLEGWLRSWARLHHGAADPHLLAGRQLGWIVEVLAGLPAAPDDAPGRDSEERRMVQALVAADPELGFEYAGIEYRSRRHELLATAMARHLERQGIPSAGELSLAARRFHELREAASSGAVDQARSIARELASLIGGWAGLEHEMDRSLKDLWPRVAPVDRETLLAQLGDVERAKNADVLRRRVDAVDRALSLMARELRPFLLAPAYVVAMGDEDNVYFEDPALVRKHLVLRSTTSEVAVDTAFGNADVVGDAAGLGAHVRGSVAGVPLALAEFSGSVGAGGYLVRDRVWFDDLVRTRWQRIPATVTRLVAAVTEIGREVLGLATATAGDGREASAALDLVAARGPLARVEAQRRLRDRGEERRLLAPSETLMVGLAAIDAKDAVPVPGVSAEAAERLAEAIAATGPLWRERLHAAGTRTPSLNGRSEPWVGDWPPYELLENERLLAALIERTMLDLRFAALDFLGRHGLPGEVGADLMATLLREATGNTELESLRDWEGHLNWVNDLDDARFDRELRALFTANRYSAQGF